MILLTGSKGFIGRQFLSKLSDEDVLPIDMDSPHRKDLDSLIDWTKVKFVLHQGAISNTSETDLPALLEHNVLFSIKLFEKCIIHRIPVKYASSAAVYGNPAKRNGPLSLYAASKHMVDLWVSRNIEHFSLVQGFRYFNVFGYGENHKLSLRQASPVTTFFHQALTLGEIRIFPGSKDYARDFVWVDDLVDIVLNNDKGSGIFDLGTGQSTSFLEVAQAVARRTGVPIVEVPMPANIADGYQPFTKASYPWNYGFKSIGEFIEECDLDKWGF